MMATLYLLATPIGNLEDISLRALRILRETTALACEDTRVTRKLLSHFDIPTPSIFFSCHEHNEAKVTGRILGVLESGQNLTLCSDAGYPGISDPGYLAIQAAYSSGFAVEVIPGPSAVLTALVTSGLPMSSYTFKGFPPNKSGKRQNFLRSDLESPHTQIFFESKYRIKAFLADALAVFGDRQAAVCVELTKKFETIYRGYLSELAENLEKTEIRGEITVVIAGHHQKFRRSE